MTTKNYARFWALLNKMPCTDREELKKSLILQFTNGRTDSLKEMTDKEYDSLCDNIQEMHGDKLRRAEIYQLLKRKRSAVLHQLQLMGIDTANWDRVNAYCQQPRISGKEFRHLTIDELDQLLIKLRLIERKQSNNSNILLN